MGADGGGAVDWINPSTFGVDGKRSAAKGVELSVDVHEHLGRETWQGAAGRREPSAGESGAGEWGERDIVGAGGAEPELAAAAQGLCADDGAGDLAAVRAQLPAAGPCIAVLRPAGGLLSDRQPRHAGALGRRHPFGAAALLAAPALLRLPAA